MSHRAQEAPPAARDGGVLVEHVGDETVVYDVEAKEAHALSPLAAAVFMNCDGQTSVARIAELTSERLGEDVSVEQVWDALVQLEERELLSAPKGGMSRRDLVKKSAAVAVSVPLITSIAMPSGAYAAISCQVGVTCSKLDGTKTKFDDNLCNPDDLDHLPEGQRCTQETKDNPAGTPSGNLNDAKSCKCYTGVTQTVTCPANTGPNQGQVKYTFGTCNWV